jgi:hypothetical protein
MTGMNALEKFGNIPIDSAVLYSITSNYNFPRNKIASMEKRGDIVRLKKGLYVVSDKISRKALSRELIANHLYGTSYVSFETALAFYGLIPEKVFAVRSATFKRAKRFENAVGRFEYVTVPENYYPIGISQQTVDNEYTYLLATPEKALCDLILATPNLRLQSVKAMQVYLEEDLRVDFSALREIDTGIIRQCMAVGRKKMELRQLISIFDNFEFGRPNSKKLENNKKLENYGNI